MTDSSRFIIPGPAYEDTQAEVLLYAFSGAIDSGDIGGMIIEQLLHALPHEEVARFALETVLDYRARRPRITIENWTMTDMRYPSCTLERITDYYGRQILLMRGLEPDINWEDFSLAIFEVCQKMGVKQAVDLMGIAANIPHTRIPFINQTSPNPDILPPQTEMPGTFIITASFGQYLQMLFQMISVQARGIVVGVPYYLADGQYPPGAVSAIQYLSETLNLDLPMGDLEAASTQMIKEVSAQLDENPEAKELIEKMEQHYDEALTQPWGELHPKSLAESVDSRSGDAIAERIERFLAQVNPQDSPDENAEGLLAGRDDLLAHLAQKVASRQRGDSNSRLPEQVIRGAASGSDPSSLQAKELDGSKKDDAKQRKTGTGGKPASPDAAPQGRYFPPRRSRLQRKQTEKYSGRSEPATPAPPPPGSREESIADEQRNSKDTGDSGKN
ncbi:PAC2 family protein [Varibaculum cambriense]|uniref:PAC2 family protein n=1 Tax=Varibaculum cambriense TaxID=184870 RepID=UPI00291547CC|nr:PAC2 family protein [Varibaculum cambriense]MDU3274581.1 PAC2 family protein [Varibaculum cambriense]